MLEPSTIASSGVRHPVDVEREKCLAGLDDVLLRDGPVAAQALWKSVFGSAWQVTDEIGRVQVTVERSGLRETEQVLRVPTVIGMTPIDARVYLTAIGKINQPLPIVIARALLAPSFSFGDSLAGLSRRRPHDAHVSSLIHLNDAHQLVLREREVGADSAVLSSGWRARRDHVFDGYPNEHKHSHEGGECDNDWPVDHDGVRLVATAIPTWRWNGEHASNERELQLPVVPLAKIAPDVSRLLDAVAARPCLLLQPAARAETWRSQHSDVSSVANRLVEGGLQQYMPWPFPFTLRNEAERAISQDATRSAVVRAFDRLLAATIDAEPPDVAAHFLALIRQGRAPLSVWPTPLEGVWGFKIRTGDHEWLKGIVWTEPGIADDRAAALSFRDGGHGGWLGSGDGRTRIECGAARCAIRRSHS